MNSLTTYTFFSLFLFIGLVSCEYEPLSSEPTPDQINESIDFSSFYVLGGTHSSGLMDGALYKGGQEYSYPSLFAQKISAILDDSTFVQANVESENGSNFEPFYEGQGKFGDLFFESNTKFYPTRRTTTEDPLTNWEGNLNELNNFSFPSLKMRQLDDPTKLTNNAYYNRIPGLSGNPLDVIIQNSPSIVVLDLGRDDLFSYAFNGAIGNENPAIATSTDADLITMLDFETVYSNILDRLIAETNAEIFIMNIPDPLQNPYFQTLSWAFETEIFDELFISQMDAFYFAFNSQVAQYNFIENPDATPSEQRPRLNFDLDNWPQAVSRAKVIRDDELFDAMLNDGTVLRKWRQLTENELIGYNLEPSVFYESTLAAQVPLPDDLALTEREINTIETRAFEYNITIEDLASSSNRIHIVNVNQVMNQVTSEEFFFDGVPFTAKFDQYSIFSADGYTLNPRGNALIANELIKEVNSVTNSAIKPFNPNNFPGISFDLNLEDESN
ncbi:MAG: hypothetical protein BalsKO_22180 [Balneolaceae bacterium]